MSHKGSRSAPCNTWFTNKLLTNRIIRYPIIEASNKQNLHGQSQRFIQKYPIVIKKTSLNGKSFTFIAKIYLITFIPRL